MPSIFELSFYTEFNFMTPMEKLIMQTMSLKLHFESSLYCSI